MKYPLAALEGLRERERDAAARALADALAALDHRLAERARCELAYQAASEALRDHRPHTEGSRAGVELQLREAYRERLVQRRDASLTALGEARAQVEGAEGAVADARRALTDARAQHRAVELHHEAHRAQQRALSEARETEALDEAAALRSRA